MIFDVLLVYKSLNWLMEVLVSWTCDYDVTFGKIAGAGGWLWIGLSGFLPFEFWLSFPGCLFQDIFYCIPLFLCA